MKGKSTKYIISIFLTALLFFKAAGLGSMIFSFVSDDIEISMLAGENDQEEKKGKPVSTTEADELFGKAILPAEDHFILTSISAYLFSNKEPIQDLAHEILTPPPNYSRC